MPSITLTHPHSLSQEEVLDRLKGFLPKVKERAGDKVSNLQEEWQDNRLLYSFSTFGFNIKGELAVEPQQVKLNIALPFAAMMAKGKIESTIREELGKLLA